MHHRVWDIDDLSSLFESHLTCWLPLEDLPVIWVIKKALEARRKLLAPPLHHFESLHPHT